MFTYFFCLDVFLTFLFDNFFLCLVKYNSLFMLQTDSFTYFQLFLLASPGTEVT